VNKTKFFSYVSLCLFSLFLFNTSVQARAWDDLYEKTSESLYGSEKAEKMPVDAFIFNKEEWKDHYSVMAFWFFKYTDYPKYSSRRIIPFWYGLDSKIDNRSFGFIPVGLTYWETDGSEHNRYNPLFFDMVDTNTGLKKDRYERTNFSLLHYYEYSGEKDGSYNRTFWFPIIPIFYRNQTDTGGHQNFLYVLDYTWNTAGNNTNIDRFWFVPLAFYRAGNNGYTTILPPLFIYNRYRDGRRYMHFLPIFIYDKNINTEYSGNKTVSEYNRTWYTLPFKYSRTDDKKWGGEKIATQLSIPIIPVLFYSSWEKEKGSHRNVTMLFDWHNNKDNITDRFWVTPIVFWKNDSYFHFTPLLYFSVKNSFTEYDKDSKSNQTVYSKLYVNPVYTSYTEHKDSYDGEETISHTLFPIIPILYYSYEKKGTESYRNILLANWHNNKDGITDRVWFSPLVFWKSNTYFHFTPLLYFSFKDSFTEFDDSTKTNNTVFSKLNLSPLYTSYTERKDSFDGEETISHTLFPIIPILYYSYEKKGTESYRNILLANWHNNKDGITDRVWFSPLVFWKSNTYFHFTPLLYFSFKDSFTEFDDSTKTNNTVFSKLNLSPLYTSYTERKDSFDGEETISHTLFPIIPVLYYSYEKKGVESRKNVLLANWHNDKNNTMDRFWLSPILYWKENSYTHILPPLYMSFFDSSVERDEKFGTERKTFSTLRLSPIWTSYTERKDSADGEEIMSRTLFPIIPILYYSYEKAGEESHRNILLANWHNDKNKTLDRFWFSPVLFWKKNSYTHVLPPIVMNFDGKDYSYTHVLPLYFGYDRTIIEIDPVTNTEQKLSAYSQVSPIFVRHNEYNDKNENVRSRFFFPIIPLYYSYYNETGVHKNAAWLVDWARNKDGDLERFWTIPFVFWKAGEGGYKVAAPFYIKPSGWSETEGYSFGLFHYNSWSPEQDSTVIWPLLHYNNDNRSEKTYTNIWTPFYWNIESPERKSTLVLPLWFDTTNNKTGKSFYINIAGLTKSIASGPNPNVDIGAGKSEYGYFIDTDVSWLYDVLSFSWRGTVYKTAEKKIETTGNVSLENKPWISRDDSVNYFGWRMLFGIVDYKAADSKRHFRWLPFMWMSWDTLENDDNYWFLTYHHSKGKDYSSYMFIPFFYSYSSPEQDQFLIFPVYGSQNIGKSYTYAVLLNALWVEYDDEKKMHEQTVLWPFINWYSSPEKSGGRFAPIFWHKRWIENEKESSRWVILPLFYHRSTSLISNGETSDVFSISPLHYYSYEKDDKSEKSKWFYPIIPLRYYSKTETAGESDKTSWIFPFYFGRDYSYTYNDILINTETAFIPIFLHYSSATTETAKDENKKEYSHSFTAGFYRSKTPEESYWTFLGLISGTSSNDKPDGETNLLFGLFSNSYENGTHNNRFLPFWMYTSASDSYTFYTALGLFRQSKEKDSFSSRFFPIYSYSTSTDKTDFSLLLNLYSNSHDGNTYHNHLLPLWWYTSTKDDYSLYTALGLFHQSRDSDEFSSRFIPFYSYKSTPDSRDLSIALGLFGSEKNTKLNYSSTTFLWHLAGTQTHEDDYMYKDQKRKITNESTWFIPFAIGFTSYDKDNESLFYEHSQWSLFHHYESEQKSGNSFSSTWWAPIIPLVYHYTSDSYTHTNALLLFDYSNNIQKGSKKFWAVPAFFARSGTDGYLSILPPVFMHWWDDKAGESSYFTLGFYETSSPDYERQNLLYLFDHIKNIREKSESYSILFSIFGKTEDEKETEYSLLWGGAARYRSFRDSDDYETSALCSIIKFQRSEDYYHSRFLPLWYYERNRAESTLVIPPLLTYDNEKSDGSMFSLWGAGLAYYRNKDTVEKTDNQKVLLGIAYDRVSEPERGYTSKGILWGALFEYKEETETDFEQYSVLKGLLYKRTTLKGETKNSFLVFF
jgi:hypothetical protein